jgi:hypothetical protein
MYAGARSEEGESGDPINDARDVYEKKKIVMGRWVRQLNVGTRMIGQFCKK